MILGIIAKGAFIPTGGGGGMDDDFSAGTLDTKWTKRFVSGSPTVFLSGGIATFTGDPATADPTVHQFYQPLPGPTGIYSAVVAGHVNTNFAVCGMYLRNSTNGKLTIYGFHNNGSGRRLVAIKFTNETTYSANLFEAADPDPGNFQPLQLELTSTDILFTSSFTLRATEAKSTFMEAGGGTIDQIGFAVCVFGAGAGQSMEIDLFQVGALDQIVAALPSCEQNVFVGVNGAQIVAALPYPFFNNAWQSIVVASLPVELPDADLAQSGWITASGERIVALFPHADLEESTPWGFASGELILAPYPQADSAWTQIDYV